MKRVFLCAALIVWSGMASAVVYKWTDGQGKVQYGDHPPDGVHAVVVELLGNHAPRTAPAPTPARPATAQQPAPAAKGQQTSDDDVKKAVDGDVAKTRDQQCADAQDRYKKLIEGRKLFKTGTNGEREYLSAEEIDSERLNAKREVDSVCNSDT